MQYKTRKSKSKRKKGGLLTSKCSAVPANFPKCGKEGCVYLNEDDTVTKQQWIKGELELNSRDLSVEGQTKSYPYSPKIKSNDAKICNTIHKIGSEDKSPCFVKRVRTTSSGQKILYEEEDRPGWCQNYGHPDTDCVVDDLMYNKFKDISKKESIIPNPREDMISRLEDDISNMDIGLDGDVNAVDTDELGDLLMTAKPSPIFTSIDPFILSNVNSTRVKGITISELMAEMLALLGLDEVNKVSELWEMEKQEIEQKVLKLGYTSSDFNETNIMIDVDDERLCEWIDSELKDGHLITPDMIKQEFGKTEILVIVDWGLLRRVSKSEKGAEKKGGRHTKRRRKVYNKH